MRVYPRIRLVKCGNTSYHYDVEKLDGVGYSWDWVATCRNRRIAQAVCRYLKEVV
jgi:hypothetical protein